ncbi:MAG: c-type cytochrome biogenesis protein CcsB [Acidobacteria bacterium]|nr:MAG: c-type cytochrome biogenesis protein CcsB [Acidobacteriota bacterium]
MGETPRSNNTYFGVRWLDSAFWGGSLTPPLAVRRSQGCPKHFLPASKPQATKGAVKPAHSKGRAQNRSLYKGEADSIIKSLVQQGVWAQHIKDPFSPASMSLILLRLTIALYSIGLLHSFLTIITRKKILFRVALFGICSGFLGHALSILYTWRETHLPVSNLHQALSFFAFVIVLAFLLSYARYRLDSLSVFIFPLVFILTLAANLISSPQQPLPEILKSIWFYIHIPSTFLGYGAFFVTFAASVMYLIQENELKRRRPQAFYYRLPSLEICDELGYKSLSIGFPLLTIGIVAGALWANKAWQTYWGWDPKIIWTFVTWLIYAVLIHYRLSAGLRGRRAAFMAIVGFIFVLFTFIGTRYLGTAHPYIQR